MNEPTDAGSTGDIDALDGNRMTEAEVDALLRERGIGVLPLADGNEGYGVPVSFGYDGETIYFAFVGFSEPSRKKAFGDATETASFLVYDVSSRERWRSVVVTGSLDRVDAEEWPRARDALAANAWYPNLFSRADPRGDIDLRTLRIATRAG